MSIDGSTGKVYAEAIPTGRRFGLRRFRDPDGLG